MHRHRVVITGLGVLAPNGCGKEEFWQACLQGRSGVRAITRFDASALPTRIAGEIADFTPSSWGLTPVECTSLDRGTQFALAAANMALEDAGISRDALAAEEREQIGVYLGTAMAAAEKGLQYCSQMSASASSLPQSSFDTTTFASLLSSYLPSSVVAAHHQFSGPCLTIATGCSAGADAIGQAFWHIQEGRAERMLAGGSDSAVCQFSIGVFNSMHALSTQNAEPERASRPYDATRDGFVLAEGAAVLLLEKRELALARGSHIYAEVVAFATNGNAHHMTALPSDGAPLQLLLRQVLREANLSPSQLGYINAHGSSTPLNDIAETAAYKSVLGQLAPHIPISATKSLIGHTQGAASAIEALVTALALDRQILPPTINLRVPDPLCDLDYIPDVARPLAAHTPLCFALTHSSGFGGVHTALILARSEDKPEPQKEPAIAQFSFTPVPVSTSHAPRRVVISGLGVVAPNGTGKLAFWDALCSGTSALEPWQDPDQTTSYIGRASDFRASDYFDRKLIRRTDRMTHFALAAVDEALQDAGIQLAQEDPTRMGAVIANTFGGVEYVLQQVEDFYKHGPRAISAYTAIAWLQVANVGSVLIRHGLQGYCKMPVNSGLDALGMAYHAIQRGAADILVAGGTEAPLPPYARRVLAASLPLHEGKWPDAYRPFDCRAAGMLVAEGAGICLLEEYEHARRRGAHIYGEIVGYAQTSAPCVPGTMVASDLAPNQRAYIRALHLALAESCLTPSEIACVYLDGQAHRAWDTSESASLHSVFGSDFTNLACSVPRTQFGHSLAAAGALDTIAALLSLQARVLPPTLGCEEPDPRSCPPALVRGQAQEQTRHAQGALLCARSPGGSHTVLALKKV